MKDYDVNELLDLLNKRDSQEESLSPIDQFIKDKNIKEGSCRIKNTVIYYTYVESGGEMSKIGFFREFNKRFKKCKYRTGKERGYKLDKSSFDLSREGLIKAEYLEKK